MSEKELLSALLGFVTLVSMVAWATMIAVGNLAAATGAVGTIGFFQAASIVIAPTLVLMVIVAAVK